MEKIEKRTASGGEGVALVVAVVLFADDDVVVGARDVDVSELAVVVADVVALVVVDGLVVGAVVDDVVAQEPPESTLIGNVHADEFGKHFMLKPV
jgi:hypothetical protein